MIFSCTNARTQTHTHITQWRARVLVEMVRWPTNQHAQRPKRQTTRLDKPDEHLCLARHNRQKHTNFILAKTSHSTTCRYIKLFCFRRFLSLFFFSSATFLAVCFNGRHQATFMYTIIICFMCTYDECISIIYIYICCLCYNRMLLVCIESECIFGIYLWIFMFGARVWHNLKFYLLACMQSLTMREKKTVHSFSFDRRRMYVRSILWATQELIAHRTWLDLNSNDCLVSADVFAPFAIV